MGTNGTRSGDDRNDIRVALANVTRCDKAIDRLSASVVRWHELQRIGYGRPSYGPECDAALKELPCLLASMAEKIGVLIGQLSGLRESWRLPHREVFVNDGLCDALATPDPHAGSRVFHLAHREAFRIERLDLMLMPEMHKRAMPSGPRKDFQFTDAEKNYVDRQREGKTRRESLGRDLGVLLDKSA